MEILNQVIEKLNQSKYIRRAFIGVAIDNIIKVNMT